MIGFINSEVYSLLIKMDSKSSSSGAPSDLCFYRRNREAA